MQKLLKIIYLKQKNIYGIKLCKNKNNEYTVKVAQMCGTLKSKHVVVIKMYCVQMFLLHLSV